MKRMKKRWMKWLWIVVIVGMLTGCGGVKEGENQTEIQGNTSSEEGRKGELQSSRMEEKKESEQEETKELRDNFQAVVRNFSPLFLSFDEDGWQYDQVLNVVEDYLGGEKNHEEALDNVKEILALLQEEMEGTEEFILEEGMAEYLSACGISAEEYKAFGNSRKNELYHYSMSTATLLEYLESSEKLKESYEDLNFFHSLYREEQDSMRGYYYYGCLNYWFAGANEEERAYLDEQVVRKIKAFLPQNPIWYDDPEKVEEVVMGYLDEVEEINGRMAKHLGEAQEKLYGMEQDAKELQDGRKENQMLEEKLARLKEINARIEEIHQEAALAKEEGDEEKLSVLKEEFEALVEEYEELMK